eukprot:14790428-Ditylum_brightwellii.AAC.1
MSGVQDGWQTKLPTVARWFIECQLDYTKMIDEWLVSEGCKSLEMLKLVDDADWVDLLQNCPRSK